jgi:hypothetical protein
MYSVCGTTLTIALAALWVMFTPPQPTLPTTPATSPTLPYPPAAPVALWSQSQRPTGIESRVPKALTDAPRTEEHSSETIDLRVPEALLEYLDGAGRLSGLEKSPAPWDEPLQSEISVILDWSWPGYAPVRPSPGQRWPPAGPLPAPAGDQYAPRR